MQSEEFKPIRTLIVYVSKHGTAEKISKKLYNAIPENTDLVDLNKNEPLDLNEYDKVIIGGPIYAGKVPKKLRKFCTDNEQELSKKHLALFICYMNKKLKETYLKNSFPEKLTEKAIAIGYMGGELNFEDMNFIEKFIVRKTSGIKESTSMLNENKISDFIAKIKDK